MAERLETEAVRRRDLEGEVLALRGTKDSSLEKALESERAKTAQLERSLAEVRAAPPPPRDESALERRVADLERLEAALMLRVEQEQAAAEENRKRLVNALRENSELRAPSRTRARRRCRGNWPPRGARSSSRTSRTATASRRSRRRRRAAGVPRRRRSSATRTRSRRCVAGPPSRGRHAGGPRPGPPSSTWDPVTNSARRGPPR